ncbi:glycosyltransferase family 2 protein [Pseudorhodoplanes sp.]|uniref:glycosyltransferase family 2 protein n=1 Tax=Pseudorhodoplanes sp. TaxID=1934341 RepID=UPI002CE5ACA2|nr:glycosyltransferase family 2 protein [Pseudorhodoplanes sp.]HWV54952.1 glycosyltransferase family 2 protein [Pseudorhodoplanes sp.]
MSDPVPDISVVLPAHNEAGNIARMAATLEGVLKPLGRYEIVFVDDGSSDGTLAAIRAAATANPQVRYISFTRNFGHQEALRAGLRHARGRAVIVMDADFEHPPELIPELVAAWRDGTKVVATRREDGEADLPALKSVTSRLYYRLLDSIGDVRIEPGSSDYMLLDRSVVDTVNGFADQDVFLRGAVRWFGFPTTTITFSRGARTYGESKYTLRRMIDLAVTGIAAHSVRPLRLAIWLSLAFAAVGLLLVIYSVVSYFLVRQTVIGWTSIMATIALLGAAQLLVLGIIGEYVGRTLRETRGRPTYIIGETEADQKPDRDVIGFRRPAE